MSGRHNLRFVLSASFATALALTLTACSSSDSSIPDESGPVSDCGNLLASVVQRSQVGDTSGPINSEMDALSASCPTQYDIATDYFAISSTAKRVGPATCDSWDEYGIRPEAIELLADDGLCHDAAVTLPEESWPDGALGWDEARDYVGETMRVCGPLATVRGIENGVFVNIGKDYPDPDRFAFVIWGDWWLDPIDSGSTICASGTIYLYNDVAQMEIGEPSELEIWR